MTGLFLVAADRRLSAFISEKNKRGRESFVLSHVSRGRPRGRRVDSNPRRLAIRSTHAASPKGRPRLRFSRTVFNSVSDSEALTQVIHCRGSATGHSLRNDVELGFPCDRRHRLDHRHFSARATNFARKALRSTYRATARKCSSVCTGKDLKRPWYTAPVPAVCRWACQRCVWVTVIHRRASESSPSCRGQSSRCQ